MHVHVYVCRVCQLKNLNIIPIDGKTWSRQVPFCATVTAAYKLLKCLKYIKCYHWRRVRCTVCALEPLTLRTSARQSGCEIIGASVCASVHIIYTGQDIGSSKCFYVLWHTYVRTFVLQQRLTMASAETRHSMHRAMRWFESTERAWDYSKVRPDIYSLFDTFTFMHSFVSLVLVNCVRCRARAVCCAAGTGFVTWPDDAREATASHHQGLPASPGHEPARGTAHH